MLLIRREDYGISRLSLSHGCHFTGVSCYIKITNAGSHPSLIRPAVCQRPALASGCRRDCGGSQAQEAAGAKPEKSPRAPHVTAVRRTSGLLECATGGETGMSPGPQWPGGTLES